MRTLFRCFDHIDMNPFRFHDRSYRPGCKKCKPFDNNKFSRFPALNCEVTRASRHPIDALKTVVSLAPHSGRPLSFVSCSSPDCEELSRHCPLCNRPSRLRIRPKTLRSAYPYQICTRFSGASQSACSGLTSNASYQASMLRSMPLTRYLGGEWLSDFNSRNARSSRRITRQAWA